MIEELEKLKKLNYKQEKFLSFLNLHIGAVDYNIGGPSTKNAHYPDVIFYFLKGFQSRVVGREDFQFGHYSFVKQYYRVAKILEPLLIEEKKSAQEVISDYFKPIIVKRKKTTFSKTGKKRAREGKADFARDGSSNGSAQGMELEGDEETEVGSWVGSEEAAETVVPAVQVMGAMEAVVLKAAPMSSEAEEPPRERQRIIRLQN